MNIDERYRAAEDEAQLEYIKQWRERERAQAQERGQAQGLLDGSRLAFADVL